MEQLTALERELLRSVEALQTGMKAEIAGLKTSLKDYDLSAKNSIDQRLSAIEDTQAKFDRLLVAISKQQHNEAEQVVLSLREFNTRLDHYEASVKSLNSTLNRLVGQ